MKAQLKEKKITNKSKKKIWIPPEIRKNSKILGKNWEIDQNKFARQVFILLAVRNLIELGKRKKIIKRGRNKYVLNLIEYWKLETTQLAYYKFEFC